MNSYEVLQISFKEGLNLPADASEFLLNVWGATQFFDDVADGDEVKRPVLDQVIWDFFIGFAENAFFQKNAIVLKSQLMTMILKWQASDQAERSGEASAKSYMWRAGYYDLVLSVVTIVHGYQNAIKLAKSVMDLYGETLEDYLEEFKDA